MKIRYFLYRIKKLSITHIYPEVANQVYEAAEYTPTV